MKVNGASIGDKGLAVTRQLPCKLDDQELLDRGDDMANAELQIDKLKADRRATNKQILEQVDRRNKLAHTIESESEMRDVSCRWHPRESEKQWELVREDTGVVVETRAMTAADLQGNLLAPVDGGDAYPVAPTSELQKQIKDATAKLPKKPAVKSPKVKAKGKGKSKANGRAHA